MSHQPDAGTRYRAQLESSLQRLTDVPMLPRPPWATLALSAAFYLDSYLPPPLYHAALDRAIRHAAAEADRWPHDSQPPASPDESFRPLIDADANRAALYRDVFERAAVSGSLTHIVLAQHACEIAEVVDRTRLLPALRLSRVWRPVRHARARTQPGAAIHTLDHLIEQLSATLLAGRIGTGRFTLALLATHASRRAAELVDPAFDSPFRAVAQGLARAFESTSVLLSHRACDPADLARRAAGCNRPWAILLAEAGLVEVDCLDDSQRSLLLAALDRVLPRRL